ncbi:MAG: hypothetical protein WBE71_05000 [Xanthobacteraceae bacterium]
MAKLFGSLCQDIWPATGDRNFSAFCQDRFSDCEPDAAGTARDQRSFSLEYHMTSLSYLDGEFAH